MLLLGLSCVLPVKTTDSDTRAPGPAAVVEQRICSDGSLSLPWVVEVGLPSHKLEFVSVGCLCSTPPMARLPPIPIQLFFVCFFVCYHLIKARLRSAAFFLGCGCRLLLLLCVSLLLSCCCSSSYKGSLVN